MTTAEWISETIDQFGRALGFPALSVDERGVIQLDIEERGRLGIEVLADHVLVSLARPVRPDVGTYQHALRLCHFSNAIREWLQAAIVGEDQLVFATRVRDREFDLTSLERAIVALSDLHETLAEGVPA